MLIRFVNTTKTSVVFIRGTCMYCNTLVNQTNYLVIFMILGNVVVI